MKQTLLAIAILTSGCSLYFEGSDESSSSGDPGNPDDSSTPTELLCGDAEVHVIGVYQTRSDHGFENHPIGDGYVRIERAGHHQLVLSAYEPTRWNLDLAPGAIVDSVHLVGYHAQSLAQSGIPVTIDTYEQNGTFACGYAWPDDGEGCNPDALFAIARSRTGSDLTSFAGCYDAAHWTIDANGDATSDCDTDAGYEQTSFAGACASASPGCGDTDTIE